MKLPLSTFLMPVKEFSKSTFVEIYGSLQEYFRHFKLF